MLDIELHLTIGDWGSKHSDRIFRDWSHIGLPYVAKNKIPDWHKNTSPTNNNNRTIKKCMPVTDMITAGYILPAPVDFKMYLTDDGGIKFDPNDNSEFFITRHDPIQYSQAPYCNDIILKFDFPWIFKTPPGWSMMYIAPAHRDNSRYEALSAIIETDTYYNSSSCPVRVKNWKAGEELVIPKGYPLVQAIPFKREDFKLSMSHVNWSNLFSTAIDLSKNPSAYRDKFREKKRFN